MIIICFLTFNTNFYLCFPFIIGRCFFFILMRVNKFKFICFFPILLCVLNSIWLFTTVVCVKLLYFSAVLSKIYTFCKSYAGFFLCASFTVAAYHICFCLINESEFEDKLDLLRMRKKKL
jgi:hypothetical protein